MTKPYTGLSSEDWQALSQAFWRAGGLGVGQTTRINDHLKHMIEESKPKTCDGKRCDSVCGTLYDFCSHCGKATD